MLHKHLCSCNSVLQNPSLCHSQNADWCYIVTGEGCSAPWYCSPGASRFFQGRSAIACHCRPPRLCTHQVQLKVFLIVVKNTIFVECAAIHIVKHKCPCSQHIVTVTHARLLFLSECHAKPQPRLASNTLVPRHACTACRAENETWYAQLQLLFCLKGKRAPEFAFVRWFTASSRPAHARNLKLQALKWETCRVGGIRGVVPKTDIISLDSIIGPCYIQPDPVNENIFWYNHWIGNVMNTAT